MVIEMKKLFPLIFISACSSSPYVAGEKYIHNQNTYYILELETSPTSYKVFQEILPNRKMASAVEIKNSIIRALEGYTKCSVGQDYVFYMSPLIGLEAAVEC